MNSLLQFATHNSINFLFLSRKRIKNGVENELNLQVADCHWPFHLKQSTDVMLQTILYSQRVCALKWFCFCTMSINIQNRVAPRTTATETHSTTVLLALFLAKLKIFNEMHAQAMSKTHSWCIHSRTFSDCLIWVTAHYNALLNKTQSIQ